MNQRLGAGSLRVRIVAAFLAALVAMYVSVGVVVVRQQPVADSLNLLATDYLPLAQRVARLKRDQERVAKDIQRIAKGRSRPMTDGTSATEIYSEELRENIAAMRDELNAMTLENAALVTMMLGQLNEMEGHFEAYKELSSAYLALAEKGLQNEAREGQLTILRNYGKLLADDITKIERTLGERITDLAESSENHQRTTVQFALAVSVLTGVLTSLLALGVLYALRPMGQLTDQVQRLAAGDYGGRVAVDGADEVALLASNINEMAKAIETRDARLKDRAAELRRLSRYLASVVDSLVDGLVVVESGKVTLTNPAARSTWGAEVGDEPPESLEGSLAEPGRHEMGAAGRRYVTRGVPFGEHGVVTVISDVTDQVRAQEALARSERLALVGQMLAQITHEVRNPLNALSLNAELLGDEVSQLDPRRETEAWELLAMISKEVERLTEVTGHYLQLARRPPARLVPVDLGRVSQEVARLLEPELAGAGVDLELELDPLPRQLVDGNQLRQALLNVVRNSVEAGAHKLLLQLQDRGEEVVVALQDDGPGMDEEQIERAVDPFFSTKATGTGLGLAITRQILEDHGGHVRVDSELGRGTRVSLVLPSHPTEDDPVELALEEAIT